MTGAVPVPPPGFWIVRMLVDGAGNWICCASAHCVQQLTVAQKPSMYVHARID
jgi:hypothetical protein